MFVTVYLLHKRSFCSALSTSCDVCISGVKSVKCLTTQRTTVQVCSQIEWVRLSCRSADKDSWAELVNVYVYRLSPSFTYWEENQKRPQKCHKSTSAVRLIAKFFLWTLFFSSAHMCIQNKNNNNHICCLSFRGLVQDHHKSVSRI